MTEPEPIGAVLGELLPTFEETSKPRRGATFEPDQLYLIEKLNARAARPLTFGGLTKLNQSFGVAGVTDAMRCACLTSEIGNVYGYVKTVCAGQLELLT